MFRLPTCPHCDTVYRYGDIVRILKQDRRKKKKERENTCYHCEKQYSVKYLPGIVIPVVVWIVLSIGTNLLMLSRMTRLNLVVMFVMTILYLILAAVITPFFIRFEKCGTKKKKQSKK